MSRLPIRVRLTLVLAVAMAIVIAAAGIVSHLVVRRALDHNMRQALSARAADVAALIGGTDDRGAPRHHVLTVRGEAYAQVLDPRGRVLDTTPRLAGVTLLTPAQTAAALRGVLIVDRPGLPGLAHRVRLFATRTIDDGPAVVVVAASLKDRNDTIRAISLMALIGGGITLLAVAVAGYWVAAAALRPVEGMRRMAEAISGAPGVQRLPLPAARDEIRGLGVTLNSMLDRVERAARHQRAFVADAGHELRTPLAILTTELELAQHPSATEADLRAAVSSAAEETERLVQLSDDLLTVAHADSGTIPVHREAVDVPDLLERLATRFGGRATAGGRTITVDAPGMPRPGWTPCGCARRWGTCWTTRCATGAAWCTSRRGARTRICSRWPWRTTAPACRRTSWSAPSTGSARQPRPAARRQRAGAVHHAGHRPGPRRRGPHRAVPRRAAHRGARALRGARCRGRSRLSGWGAGRPGAARRPMPSPPAPCPCGPAFPRPCPTRAPRAAASGSPWRTSAAGTPPAAAAGSAPARPARPPAGTPASSRPSPSAWPARTTTAPASSRR
ncbi:MAG: histidine kinase dimerization/phospho-acceptor domain-containing protein [Thermoleophilia bacterium]